MLPSFAEFPKIFRLNREIIVTEKLDGANASIHVADDGTVHAGSRTKWVTPEDDLHGFAKWVKAHEETLRVGLGFGTHYGEWWGQGIPPKRYTIKEKRFSLFNVSRWSDDVRPSICHIVPILYKGLFSEQAIKDSLEKLRTNGSVADPDCKKPEGIVVFHVPSMALFKVTLEKDEDPKSKWAGA